MSDLERRLAGLSPPEQALLRAHSQSRQQGSGQDWSSTQPVNENDLPLSFAQERIWLHQQLVPDSLVYNRPANIRLRGPLRVDLLPDS